MELKVELGSRSYPIVLGQLAQLGPRLAQETRPGRCVLVSNEVVAPLHARAALGSLSGAGFEPTLLQIPDGEANKTLEAWQTLVAELLELGVDRQTPLISLGGGVTGDIVGFAAASTMRGLPFVQVPTTLLAMVDASVGGKTGVNTSQGKNLVGSFYQPILVLAAMDTLATLSPEEFRCGLGEVLKHAVLEGESFFEWLGDHAQAVLAQEPKALEQAIARCCAYKAQIVAQDEREGGIRALLNCGHTLGHALERELGFGSLRHGEAVAIGMLGEAAICVSRGEASAEWIKRLRALTLALGLPVQAPGQLHVSAIVQATRHDKKRAHGILTAALPAGPGRVTLSAVTPAELSVAAQAILPPEAECSS